MKYDYATIKRLAREFNMRVPDLLALAVQNDPFYCGTPADITNGQWFASIWAAAGYTNGVHLRRVHYWTVSQNPPIEMPNGKPYENTERCWDYLTQASKLARYLGLVQIRDIIDKKNPTPHIHAQYTSNDPDWHIYLPDLTDPYIGIEGLNSTNAQPYHMEIWCEKSTMDDVLMPVCRKYGCNLVTFEGEVSITSCYELMRRIETSGGKPTRIWYISDFDPAGNSMPVAMSRKVEFMLSQFELAHDVKIRPVALTLDQIESYKLPRIPIKETERRADKFERAFGTGAVELDALEALWPGELAGLINDELSAYYSREAARETERQQNALRAVLSGRVAEITDQYVDAIAAIKEMFEKIRQIDVDASEYAVERYQPHVRENDDWLFDSGRDYPTQIVRYKRHKNPDPEVA